jgi:DNA-binding NtrC family response regulator
MAKILFVDDDMQMQLAVKANLSRAGHEVLIANNGTSALELLASNTFEIIISDQQMPLMNGIELLEAVQQKDMQIPFVIVTAHGTITQAVDAMQRGAADFIQKPFTGTDLLRVVDKVQQHASDLQKVSTKKNSKQRPIITNDPLMIKVLEVAEAVARSDATVLIQGESGTGKELIARLIHTSSHRRGNAFVAVNCAALPESLLESELFGHEKGAFTGAQNKKLGKFELAHGGTILLDEISEMELPLQAKLLRVLQEREVDRIGGKEPIAIDVRVVATTNRSLHEMVASGKFRADLYYRLNVIPLTVPSLRQRGGDIRLLIRHFMQSYMGNDAPKIPETVLELLDQYQWPGNIRELQNAVERAAILSQGNPPRKEDFLLSSMEMECYQSEKIYTQKQAFGMAAHDNQFRSSENNREGFGGFLHYNDTRASSVFDQGFERAENLNLQNDFQEKNFLTQRSYEDAGSSEVQRGKRIVAGTTVQEMEKELILETLKATNKNRTQAAKLLGISIRTLRNKLNEYRME